MSGDIKESLLELPFDQYQRYRLLADIVETLDDRKSLSILEVGGAPVKLPDFLPGRKTTVTDLQEDKHHSYARADALSLPFADGCFDLVASLDTLEHVPPESRGGFIAELARLSGRYLVLAAPFSSEASREAERIIFDFIKTHLGYEHLYFKEHLSLGLPDMVEVESHLVSLNFHTLILPNGLLDRWLLMMFVYYYLEGDPAYADLKTRISAFYNRHYHDSDNAEPAYRHFIVASREAFGDLGESILGLSQAEPSPAPDFEPVKNLIELAGLDRAKVFEREIGNLEDQLHIREDEISGLREHVSRLEDFVKKTRSTLPYRIYRKFLKKKD